MVATSLPRLTPFQRDLVTANLGLVRWSVARFAPENGPGNQEYEDAVAAAAVGLVEAARRFDPSRGVAFGTYAVPWCRAMLNRWRTHNRRWDHGPSGRRFSLDVPVGPTGRSLAAFVPDPAADEEPTVDAVALARAVDRLRPQRQRVLRLLYWEGLTAREAGARLGVSRQRVRRVREEALADLRDRLGEAWGWE